MLQELSAACEAAGLDAEARSCLEAAVAAAPRRGPVAVASRLQLAQVGFCVRVHVCVHAHAWAVSA